MILMLVIVAVFFMSYKTFVAQPIPIRIKAPTATGFTLPWVH